MCWKKQKKNKEKKEKYKGKLRLYIKRTFLILLTYLIPLINISVVIANHGRFKSAIIAICSVLSSTSGASACTIKGIKGDKNNKLNIMQAFALVFSVVSFMSCLVYEIMNFLCINKYEIIVLTALANLITIAMFILADVELVSVIDDYEKVLSKEVDEMVDSATAFGKKDEANINLTPKGGNNNG